MTDTDSESFQNSPLGKFQELDHDAADISVGVCAIAGAAVVNRHQWRGLEHRLSVISQL